MRYALVLLVLVCFGYFNYWQGYYRGADTVLCIVATDLKADKKIIDKRCSKTNLIYFHWSDE